MPRRDTRHHPGYRNVRSSAKRYRHGFNYRSLDPLVLDIGNHLLSDEHLQRCHLGDFYTDDLRQCESLGG
jgi:hypothetical protein